MKKITRVLLAAVLLISMLSVSAFAANGTTIEGDSVEAQAGGTATVEFTLKGNPGVAAITATIEADDALEIVKVEQAELPSGSYNVKNGVGRISFGQATNVTEKNVVLCKVKVNVLASEAGKYPVKLTLNNFTNDNETQLKERVTVVSGNVVIPEVVIPHEHDWSDWKADGATGHSRDCACGEKQSAKHEYGEWAIIKAATETEDGEKARTCSVCGYVDTEVIKYDVPGNGPENDPIITEEPDTGDNSNMLIFGIIALIAAAVGTGAVFTRRKTVK